MKGGTMKQQKRELRIVEIILAVVILLLAGFIAWQTLFARDTSEPYTRSLNQGQKVYTDTASVYELMIPKNWTVRIADTGTHQPLPDATKYSRAIYLSYPDAPKLSTDVDTVNEVLISATATSGRATLYGETFAGAKAEKFDDYELLHSRTSEQYGYVDERYLITNGSHDVYLLFRVKQTGKAGLNATTFDESDILPEVLNILYSVKFLQTNGATDLPLSQPAGTDYY
jgi:hypothetical protein